MHQIESSQYVYQGKHMNEYLPSRWKLVGHDGVEQLEIREYLSEVKRYSGIMSCKRLDYT